MENKESRAYLKQLRVTPRKVKVVLDLIRGKDVAVAAAILKNTNKLVCEDIVNPPSPTRITTTVWIPKSFTSRSASSLPASSRT